MLGAGLTVVSVGQARPDKLALKPYWGKPDVRHFREGDGNVGIIRSPVRAISLPDLSARGAWRWTGTSAASRRGSRPVTRFPRRRWGAGPARGPRCDRSARRRSARAAAISW